MKNQVIKKIMAYLLVGAMVLTTPMTASANELENAYSTESGDATKKTDTNTDTDTNSGGTLVQDPTIVPEVIKKHDINILGIAFDKDSLDMDEGDKDVLHVRVLLDDYDAADEEMAWKALTADERAMIESQLHWYSANSKVAKAETGSEKATDGIITAVGNGQTTVTAWIEADGYQYVDSKGKAINKPTDHDIKAEATVTVSNGEVTINDLNLTVYAKHEYKLAELVTVTASGNRTLTIKELGEDAVFTNLSSNAKNKATLSDDGVLKLTAKASENDGEYTFNVTTKSADTKQLKVKVGKTVAATDVKLESKIEKDNATKSLTNTVTNEGKRKYTETADLGKYEYKQIVTAVLAPTTPEKSTDAVTWKSNKPKVVKVESINDTEATITALGTGKATITATATSGKKATLEVTVEAKEIEISAVEANGVNVVETGAKTYTGKNLELVAKVTGKESKIGIPYASIKGGLKWESTKPTHASNAKLAPAKDKATVKPGTLLYTADKKGNIESETITVTVQQKDVAATKKTVSIVLKQSNIADITVSETTTGASIGRLPAVKSANTKAYVGKSYTYQASAYVNKYEGSNLKVVPDTDQDDAIAWSVSGKTATINGDGKLSVLNAGKTVVTASYVTLKQVANGKVSAKLNKKTVPVQLIQNATAIAFKTPVVVKYDTGDTNKAQKISFAISNVTPKKATYNVTDWKVLVSNSDYKVSVDGYVDKNSADFDKTIRVDAKDAKGNFKKTAAITVPKGVKKGTVIKVGAYTDGGVIAYGYIYVTDQTPKANNINFTCNNTDKPALKVGESQTLSTNYGSGKPAKIWDGGNSGKAVPYDDEPVTYAAADKNSAKLISISMNSKKGENGTCTVKALKAGNAKVNVLSASGKKLKTITIKISNP